MLIWHGSSQNHGRSAGVMEGDADLKACVDRLKAMIEGLPA